MTLLLLLLIGLLGGVLGAYGLSTWWTHAIIMGSDNLTAAWLVIALIAVLAGAFELFVLIRARRARP
jgi:hypothetical protein